MRRQHMLVTVLGGGGAKDTYETPSYINAGGTGDRSALITITSNLVQDTEYTGSLSEFVNGAYRDVLYFAPAANSGKYFRFQFANKVIINESKLYQDRTGNHGSFKWQGSDNGTSWTDIGAEFTWTGSIAGSVDNSLAANTTGYTYYQLLGVSGNFSGSPYVREIEFSIGNINP